MPAAVKSPTDDAFVIEDAATLKAIADPLRLRLLTETADEPRSVKELAAALGVPQTRLYYHVRILERHGLLRVAERRMVSGIEERRYLAVAKSLRPGPSVMSALVKSGLLSAILDLAGAELELALSEASDVGDPSGWVPGISFTHLAMSVDDVEEVQRRIASVMLDFGVDPPRSGKPEYHALFCVYRVHGTTAMPSDTPEGKRAHPTRRKARLP
jgi:DNA-binding transcriptional ArsR family regulator